MASASCPLCADEEQRVGAEVMPNRTLDCFGAEQILGSYAVSTGKGFLGCKLAEPIGQPTFFGHCHHGPDVTSALRRFPGAAMIDAGTAKERRSALLLIV
jgi:hypothetical protein